MAVFFIVYQQLENHLLQPLVYGRTVQLSPLAVRGHAPDRYSLTSTITALISTQMTMPICMAIQNRGRLLMRGAL
jgi:hypothetical protein